MRREGGIKIWCHLWKTPLPLLPPVQPTLETLNHSYHCPSPLFCFLWYTNTRPSRHLRKCEGFFARRRRCLAALQNTADTVWFIRNLWTFAMQHFILSCTTRSINQTCFYIPYLKLTAIAQFVTSPKPKQALRNFGNSAPVEKFLYYSQCKSDLLLYSIQAYSSYCNCTVCYFPKTKFPNLTGTEKW